jgi:hypothetical protein
MRVFIWNKSVTVWCLQLAISESLDTPNKFFLWSLTAFLKHGNIYFGKGITKMNVAEIRGIMI